MAVCMCKCKYYQCLNFISQAMAMTEEPPPTAYEKYVDKLVKCLPMDDAVFITELTKCKLLPGDTSSQLEALPTQAKKALYFLNHVIKPALDIEDISNFEHLLSVMEHCGYPHVEKLACEIKSEIDKGNETEIGSYVCVLILRVVL